MTTPNLIPDWLHNTLEARDYVDTSGVCNWAHGLYCNSDGLNIEVNVIQIGDSKPAIWLLAMDYRHPAQLSPEEAAAAAGAVNPRAARIHAEMRAEANKPFEHYLATMVSTPDAAVAALAAFERELSDC